MRDRDNTAMYPKRAGDLKVADLSTLIQKLDFGPTMDDAAVAELARTSLCSISGAGVSLKAGDPADSLSQVHGRVKLCRIDPQTKREAVIDILSEGSCLGSRLSTPQPDVARIAQLLRNSRLIRVPAGDFQKGMVGTVNFRYISA